jgi:hypothetical protein
MTATLTELIDKQDNFEIVRDQIAGILETEQLNQQQLAIDGGKDPDNWRLNVYLERSNPWEQWLRNNDVEDTAPIVNVWVDNSSMPGNRGDTVQTQGHDVTYNIDCYGYGVSKDDANGGHVAGDKVSALEAQRAIRLVRNILFASLNTYLQLRGLVTERKAQSFTFFQAAQDTQPTQNVQAARLSLVVKMIETSPEITGETLESIYTQVKRASDGKVVIEAEYI